MRVRVIGSVEDLERDLRDIPIRAVKEMKGVLRDVGARGNFLARSFATVTAGRHGKLYPRAFSIDFSGFTAEYGPDRAMPQGNMEFEFGSRNQPPHLDLNKSADIVGPELAKKSNDMLGKLFWG